MSMVTAICRYSLLSKYLFVLFLQLLPFEALGKRVDEYLDALCLEIRETARMMKNYKLDTIYIGGGTPTTLERSQTESS